MATVNRRFTRVMRLIAVPALMILTGPARLEGQLTPIEVIDGRPLAKVIREPQEVVSALVKTYNSASVSDAFQVIQQGALYHVVPTKSLDAKGEPRERRSRFDVAVTVDDRERSAYEMLAAVLQQVSAAAGEPLGLGLVPMNLLMSAKIRGGAQEEKARDVIVRTLEATSAPSTCTWSNLKSRKRLVRLKADATSEPSA